jgi:hypothetical protein
MAIYAVKITEIRERTIYIDCDYDFEALSKAEERYDDEYDLLDKDYVTDVKFENLEEEWF